MKKNRVEKKNDSSGDGESTIS